MSLNRELEREKTRIAGSLYDCHDSLDELIRAKNKLESFSNQKEVN